MANRISNANPFADRPAAAVSITSQAPPGLLMALRRVVGRRHVLTRAAATARYRIGYRSGTGTVAAVVRPGSLVEQWRVLQACVAADVVIIMQAANTGLTGGSTPDGDDYDRPVIIISTRRLTGIHLIEGGRQAICLPGATLYQLEHALRPLGREPHSVIGSSCIGASVIGGVCNNSGGALVQRGPAYTESALYARLDADRKLRLVNHLGIDLGVETEAMLERVEAGRFASAEIAADGARCSDPDYLHHVRQIDADTPARYNADPRRLFEASGSAGKLAVFAVRLDTFPAESETAVFYIGTNDPAILTKLRREILSNYVHLPVAAEYMHRDCFDIADRYGKDTVLAIEHLGSDRLPLLFATKARLDAVLGRFGRDWALTDRFLQGAGRLAPDHLPARMRAYRDRFEHHLLLRMAGTGIAEARTKLGRMATSECDWFECSAEEGRKAFLHRFAAAGAAVRYRAVHPREAGEIVALDVALPRSTRDWFEQLPSDIDEQILHRLYYGHFLCHVFHQDYIMKPGHDADAVKHRILCELDLRGAEYPAEHNVGHLYYAKVDLAEFYQSLDPCNVFNPGIGVTSKNATVAGHDRSSGAGHAQTKDGFTVIPPIDDDRVPIRTEISI